MINILNFDAEQDCWEKSDVEQVFHKRKRDRANVDRKPDYDPSGGRKDDV